MIEISSLTKCFGNIRAVNDISLTIREQEVFGLIGTNGAGKSTLLRMMTGVFRPDGGEVRIDGELVFDNPAAKRKIFFIPDEPFYFRNSTPEEMRQYYSSIYPEFDSARFRELLSGFSLDPGRRIAQFSKGMKKQLAVILGISAGTKYLVCDETFDGLDPVMRQAVKSIFANDMVERGLTPVIASHNLRELEDVCDHVGLLHQGGVLLSEDLDEMKLGIQKLQCVFEPQVDPEAALSGLEVLNHVVSGRVHTITVRTEREALEQHFRGVETIFFEILPLTLEEIFISETEVVGYDVRKIILQ